MIQPLGAVVMRPVSGRHERASKARVGWTFALSCLGALEIALASAPASAQTSPAQPGPSSASNLNINPKRITFDRLGKSAAVYVFNQGGGAGAFDVRLVDRLMLPSGEIIPLSDAADRPELKHVVDRLKSARDMLAATPRRVTLPGNTGQTIRIRASSLTAVPPGEYRTHLTVTSLPPPESGVTAEDAASARAGALTFRVDTVLSLSIPVIIRVGPADMRAAIEDATIGLEDVPTNGSDKPSRTAVLSFKLARAGTSSLFGDVEVRGARERGSRDPLGIVRGVGVYPEIDSRLMKVVLRRVPAPRETIELIFRDEDLAPGKVLARASVTAP